MAGFFVLFAVGRVFDDLTDALLAVSHWACGLARIHMNSWFLEELRTSFIKILFEVVGP